MLIILSIYQDVLTGCYTDQTTLTYDINTNIIEVTLQPSNNQNCQNFHHGVRANLSINSPLKEKIPLVQTTIPEFSYKNTLKITFLDVFTPGTVLNTVFSAQLDIYTYGTVITTSIINFMTQKSNLQECYFPDSQAQIFRNRIIVSLRPTGFCTSQMQLKDATTTNYIESVQFSLNGILLALDLTGFDYSVPTQEMTFHADILDLITEVPILTGKIIFSSSQSGLTVNFDHQIGHMNLETVPGFLQKIQVGFWNSKIYLNITFNQSLFDAYLAVKGPQTVFKFSFLLKGETFSFSKTSNYPIAMHQLNTISCSEQILQMREICNQFTLDQVFEQLQLDIISTDLNNQLVSMFKFTPVLSKTCWVRATGVIYRHQQMNVTLYQSGKCKNTEVEMILVSGKKEEIRVKTMLDSASLVVFKTDIKEFFVTKYKDFILRMIQDGVQFNMVVDNVQKVQVDIMQIVVVLVGCSIVIYCLVDSVSGIVFSYIAIKNQKKSGKKLK